MRILITGSRKWTDKAAIRTAIIAAVRGVSSRKITVVLGGARGADTLAGEVADELDIDSEVHRPDYARYPGKQAPLERNEHMVRLGADVCLAFPESAEWSGTWHCIRAAEKAGIPVIVHEGVARG